MEALENAEVSSEPDQQLEDDFVLLVSCTLFILGRYFATFQYIKANSGEPGVPVYVVEQPE